MISVVTLKTAAAAETLVALLEDALSSETMRRAMLADTTLTYYAAYQDSEIVGAVIVRWGNESEIELLAIDAALRRQGLGRAVVAEVLGEARRRGVKRLLVGTGNFSLDNIAFHQKCGFRVSHVRRGHFDDVDPPEFWQGVKLRDMIVLDYDLTEKVAQIQWLKIPSLWFTMARRWCLTGQHRSKPPSKN